MQTFKSKLPSIESISDLKDILSIAFDPKKARAFLEELEKNILELKKAQDEYAALKDRAEKKLEEFGQKEKEIEQKDALVFNKNKEVFELYSALKAKEDFLKSKEKSLDIEKAELAGKMHSDLSEAAAKMQAADQKHAMASMAEQKAQELKKEFEEKLNKIKSLAG